MQQTPMLKQYLSIKNQYPDTILFFRLGDFYEMFYQDAEVASKILEITLTSRNKGSAEAVPLCGVPHHAAQSYIAKLLASGKKVAICEQVEDPKEAKGVVKREVTRIVTPGTVLDEEVLEATQPNTIVSAVEQKGAFGFAHLDISTGHFAGGQTAEWHALIETLSKLEPKEILIPRSWENGPHEKQLRENFAFSLINLVDEPKFDPQAVQHLSQEAQLQQKAPLSLAAAGCLWHYACYTQQGPPPHLKSLAYHTTESYLAIDDSAQKHLELLQTQDRERKGSLLHLLDETACALGARLLRQWLLYPLIAVEKINERQEAVQQLFQSPMLAEGLRKTLAEISDLERLMGRVALGSANARDLVALKRSLKSFPKVIQSLKSTSGLLQQLQKPLCGFDLLTQKIDQTLIDEPPLAIKEGGLIRDGVHAELDELRAIQKSGKGFIAALESKERQQTGIASLKIRYNSVFGYYIEITHTHREKVPVHYIRKQTLVNAERYITPELKNYEEKVLGAEEKIQRIEYELFGELRQSVMQWAAAIQNAAAGIATLDVLQSFACVAQKYHFVRPTLHENFVIHIEEGRHPIVEAISTERFVPNDIHLDEAQRFLMITGPNMAGKSTVMRQVAIIILMAQMGSFVPAAKATIGVVDRILTRVGAFDRMSRGESTFMVEMIEAAQILKTATAKSLILIDEIGRGTSTYDGVAIAWAVAEHIHQKIGAKTLFATHYHELIDLPDENPGMKNCSIAIREWNDRIIFLRKLVAGGTSKSYGVEVAKLAGLPTEVIGRAREVLRLLEAQHAKKDLSQLPLFQVSPPTHHPALETLAGLNLDQLTPLDALTKLHDLKKMLKS